MWKLWIFLAGIVFLFSCGNVVNNEVWKQNPYNNYCYLINTNYNNYIFKLPNQYPQTTCSYEYYSDYEDYYYYCNDSNGEIWYYFKTKQECINNGGIIW